MMSSVSNEFCKSLSYREDAAVNYSRALLNADLKAGCESVKSLASRYPAMIGTIKRDKARIVSVRCL